MPQIFFALSQQKLIVAMISTAIIGLYRLSFNHFQAWAMSCLGSLAGRAKLEEADGPHKPVEGRVLKRVQGGSGEPRIMWMCRWLH
jgi:hypothetical protein